MRELLTKVRMVKEGLAAALSYKERCANPQLAYEEAVKTLNSLQTNYALLMDFKKRGKTPQVIQAQNVAQTAKFLERSGVSLSDLDQLSVIHVAGTKGKGSTCAFCESILRHHGYKTGFYSSPHLVAVRERIRINGQPISQPDFTKYFWNVYSKLEAQKEHKDDMPAYFKFLTVMALNVFLAEKVDVAIIEVGIGGECDCTNVFRKVVAVGITPLGLDHTSLLGNTIEEIAWQKAGIMKPGAVAFTSEQPAEAMAVLRERSTERRCPLWVAPALARNSTRECVPHQMQNASLAVQLSSSWLSQRHGSPQLGVSDPAIIDSCTALGLQLSSWPGRTQVIQRGKLRIFLDGAHTYESMQLCAAWFRQMSRRSSKKRVLVFNITGDRDAEQLLSPLSDCDFDTAFFCPNVLSIQSDNSDQTNYTVSPRQMSERCQKNERAWISLQRQRGYFASTRIFPCVSEAFHNLDMMDECDVLVTGSLHLIGSVLSILDPDLTLPTFQVPPNSEQDVESLKGWVDKGQIRKKQFPDKPVSSNL